MLVPKKLIHQSNYCKTQETRSFYIDKNPLWIHFESLTKSNNPTLWPSQSTWIPFGSFALLRPLKFGLGLTGFYAPGWISFPQHRRGRRRSPPGAGSSSGSGQHLLPVRHHSRPGWQVENKMWINFTSASPTWPLPPDKKKKGSSKQLFKLTELSRRLSPDGQQWYQLLRYKLVYF